MSSKTSGSSVANRGFRIKDRALVYKESLPAIRIGERVGPFRVMETDDEMKLAFTTQSNGPRSHSIYAQLKHYNSP